MATWGQIRLALVAFVKSNGGGTLPFHVLNGAINGAYEKVLAARRWRKLNVDGTLAVVAPVTAGTVAVTQGTTGVTLTGATWDWAVSGRKFRVVGQQVWYVISWLTATTGQLDRAFEDESQAAAGYEIFQDEYELPDDCNAVRQLTDVRSGYPLAKKDSDWITQNNPSLMRKGDPEAWAPTTSTSESDVKRVQVYPVPMRALSLKIRYKLIATGFDGSNDGDGPLAWVSSNAIELDAKATIAREHLKNLALAQELRGEYQEAELAMHREEMQEGSVVPLRMDPHYTRRSL
jgi:hypothetical protein